MAIQKSRKPKLEEYNSMDTSSDKWGLRRG